MILKSEDEEAAERPISFLLFWFLVLREELVIVPWVTASSREAVAIRF